MEKLRVVQVARLAHEGAAILFLREGGVMAPLGPGVLIRASALERALSTSEG